MLNAISVVVFLHWLLASRATCFSHRLSCPNENILTSDYRTSQMKCFEQTSISFTMGTNRSIFKNDGEGPSRSVILRPFCIDQTEVSNHQFDMFVKSTRYVTDAEKTGDSFCFIHSLSEYVKQNIEKAVSYYYINIYL